MKTFIMNYYPILLFGILFFWLADTTISFNPFKISMKSLLSAIGLFLVVIGLSCIISEAKTKAKHEGVLQGMEEMTKAISEEIENGNFNKPNE